ncbi:uncharacterized protein LOC143027344 [Oratosquilla oratoria]|uniref:uncharacterized protein LOC143027344 n=1 Tax=Oratosquilla oratoria TaxID=337810 RepID=UPI003F76B984
MDRKNFIYKVGDEIIEEKEALKDLGVWMSSDCNFKEHIALTAKFGRRMSGWLLRTFKTRAPEHLLPLWKTLVVSKMEYACQLWSPHRINEIQELEQVQRVFVRRIDRDSNNYWERLKNLQLYSLQRRRERYIIIYAWKILEGTVPNPSPGDFRAQHHPRFGRTCARKAVSSCSQRIKTIQAESFFGAGPRLFNCLPRDIRDLKGVSTEAFKRRLDKFLTSLPDEPPIPHGPTSRGAASNSIIDQLQYLKCEQRCGSGGSPDWPW